MDRRSFFATVFGGFFAALWPCTPRDTVCVGGREISLKKVRGHVYWPEETVKIERMRVSYSAYEGFERFEIRLKYRDGFAVNSMPLEDVLA